jgi:enoyl-[acyl-carrier protein] reductase II
VAHCNLPIIAAGGIASGKSMLAAMALGAEGVQIGSRFAAAEESSAHQLFKTRIWDTQEGGTMLALKKLAPTRLIKNEFYQQVKQLEDDGADAETMKQLLGKGRAKQGMFEGDLDNGELEIGQVASMLTHPETVEAIFNDILQDYRESLLRMNHQTL